MTKRHSMGRSGLGLKGNTHRRFRSQPHRRKLQSFARECTPPQRAAIEEYVAKHVGPVVGVLHEIRSEIVHVDVHVVPPCLERPSWFLFTAGMSALPMRVPDNMGLVSRAELSVMLPAWWQIDLGHWKRDQGGSGRFAS